MLQLQQKYLDLSLQMMGVQKKRKRPVSAALIEKQIAQKSNFVTLFLKNKKKKQFLAIFFIKIWWPWSLSEGYPWLKSEVSANLKYEIAMKALCLDLPK